MQTIPTRILQDTLKMEQIRLERDIDPAMIKMRKDHISCLAKELLRRWRIQSNLTKM